MVAKRDTHIQELISPTREMVAQEYAHTREVLAQLIRREFASLREHFDAKHAEKMAAIQRLTDAFLSHSHDTDGTVRFRIPPPVTPPPEEQQHRGDDEP